MRFLNKNTLTDALLGSGAILGAAALGNQDTQASTEGRPLDAAALLGLSGEREDLNSKDRNRVRKITRPATDFFQPERFENMRGGAATSLKKVNRDAFTQS